MSGSDTRKPARRWSVRGGLGIQSKLLIMLLLVSVISITVTGAIGYVNGRESLTDAAYAQLTTIRELRAAQVESTVRMLQEGAIIQSRTSDTVQASEAFNEAFDQLNAAGPYPEDRDRLLAYYTDVFVPELESRSGIDYSAEGLLPASDAGIYLQSLYTTSGDFEQSLAMSDAGDGSAWSAVSARYNDYFRGLIDELGYEDILLTNTEGQVVYSAYKGIDLGDSLFEAPASQTALSQAVSDVLATGSRDITVMTDFERYVPSLDVPTAWMVTPVGTDTEITGTMAIQVPISTLNAVLTGNEDWQSQGLGESGEVFLVGTDGLMRTVSREVIEHPDLYADTAVAAGLDPETARRIVEVKGTVLLQPVDTAPVAAALSGQSGTALAEGYLGRPQLTSYAPLVLSDGPQWVIIATMDESEAFAPVAAFTRTVLLSAGLLTLIVAVLALVLSRTFTRPLERLMSGVRRVTAGERDVVVDTRTRDEYAELGAAFNEFSRSLQTKADLLDAERAESERILLSLMPAAVAERYRQGDEAIAEDHTDVTVIYADIVGFDEYAAGMSSADALATLNEIVLGLDELAAEFGVERVRTTKQGYLASCGLSVPRVDSARRVVEFAAGAQRLVSRLAAQWGTRLAVRAGIDSGKVTTGIVGRNSVVYDMWGDAVSLAHRLQAVGGESGIFLSQAVVDRLGGVFPVADAGTLDGSIDPRSTRVWQLDTAASRE